VRVTFKCPTQEKRSIMTPPQAFGQDLKSRGIDEMIVL